jgi:hypothetical protein
MIRKSLARLMFTFLLLSSYGFAQSNEIGFVVGGMLSPNTDRVTGVACISTDPNCAAANRTSSRIGYEGVVAHRLANLHLASFYLELPVVGVPERTVRHASLLPGTVNVFQSYSSVFFTPGLKLKFSVPVLSPFVSVGGGFAHFSPDTNSLGTTPSSSTTGAFQVGGGIDLGLIPHIAFRGEVREFYTGDPFSTFKASPHNIFAGGGLVLHF